MEKKTDERFQEKLEGKEHKEDISEAIDYRAINDESAKEARKEFEQKVDKELDNDLENLKKTLPTQEEKDKLDAEYQKLRKFDGAAKMKI